MKIALSGYGKMGRAIEKVALEREHQIMSTFNQSRPITAKSLAGSEVLIDFSGASALDAVVDAACAAGVNLVIGTTGWNNKLDSVRERCEKAKIAAVHGANFSLGANALFSLARRAGAIFAAWPGYECGIEERHHSKKKDSPSGTALRLASEVTEGSGAKLQPPIAATRVGAEFGLHTLFFDSADDLVELSHRARGRDGFARGAVIAAETLGGKKGFFSFAELMGF